jgi:hypothetical protein
MIDEPHALLAGSHGYAPPATCRKQRGLGGSASWRPKDSQQIGFAPFDFGAKRIVENACGSIDHKASVAFPEMDILPAKQDQEHRAAKFRKIEARKRVGGTALRRVKIKSQAMALLRIQGFLDSKRSVRKRIIWQQSTD